MERINYEGWQDCLRLTNGSMELVITTAIGPRIIHCGFVGKQNLFGVMEDTKGLTGGDEWHLYGGHRLWHSPEIKPRTYSPDNSPIEAEEDGEWLHLIQPVEPGTGIGKEMQIRLDPSENRVDLVHTLTNHGCWDVEFAAWALTVMAKNGEMICPQPQGDMDALLPNRWLVLWPYTNMADPRLTWGEQYIRMRQCTDMTRKCKFGLSNEDGWLAYLVGGDLFVKRFDYEPEADYPDGGCSVELFTNNVIMEVETLGPIAEIEPGGSITHIERWYLFDNVAVDETEKSIEKEVFARVSTTE